MKIIISLATYPKRLEKLKKVIPTLIQQTLQVDEIIVNIPDNLMEVEYQQYDQLQKEFPQISVKRRDGRWRSANKYIWTYKDNPDAVIMTCDDDILYESTRFEELYNEWQINPNCIICHEINPMLIIDGKVKILNSIDIKLKQREFGKYLTGCCLFPPHCMDGTDLYNFEQFFKMTHACHDEIWFWILTTLKGIQCIGLNCTYSFDLDGAAMPAEDTALCHINGKQENILKYEDLINAEYGKQLIEKMTSIPCQFEVTKDNLLSYIGNMTWLNSIYKSFCVQFIVKGLPKSSMMYFARAVNQFKWNRIQVLQASKMNCQISIVNFNTTSMTNAALKSIRKFSQLPIVVFDNSNIEKFQLDSDITNTVVIDNTEGEVIDFKTDLQQLDAKYKIPAIIKELHAKGNNFGSYKHCKTIQWLLDNCKYDNMILFDSDIVVLKDFADIVDENVITSAEVFIKNMHYSRFLPFMQYFNCKMIKNANIKYFDASRMQDISKYYVGYDTGGSFYEDVNNKRLPVKQICLKDYILHYGAGSWKPTKYSGKLEHIEQRN